MSRFSRRHYRLVSPPPDTPEALAERLRRNAASEQVGREVQERWPTITAENVGEVLAWQTARLHELVEVR